MSDYDLNTAEAMLETKRFLYVGFMCHQAIEKILKGYYVKVNQKNPPYTHNLTMLAKRSELHTDLTEQQLDVLDMLGPLNIESRYPTHKDAILKALGYERCNEIILQTKELSEWIKNRL